MTRLADRHPTRSVVTPCGPPPPQDDPLGALADDLRLAVGRLARRIRQQHTVGLTPSQHSALASIERLEPVRLGDLAAAEGVAAPTASKVVASLEDAGLVSRTADTADRRSVQLTLTAGGRETLVRIRNERTAFLRQRLEALDADELRLLEAALPLLVALVGDDR